MLLCGHTPRQPGQGIELRADGADPIVVPGPVHTDPALLAAAGPVDVVLLAVKDTQNDAASSWLTRLCDERTIVVALQNGVEQVERVQPLCPSSAVVPAFLWFNAQTQPDGWVRLRGEAALVLPDGPPAQAIAELLRGAGCRVNCDPDFATAAWRKLIVNSLVAMTALTGRRSGMFRRDDIAALSRDYVAECLPVARAEGARLPDDLVGEFVEMVSLTPEDLTSSILTDRENHRRLEWDLLNGVIVRKARAHGLPTPVGDVLVPLLAAASDGPG